MIGAAKLFFGHNSCPFRFLASVLDGSEASSEEKIH